MWNAKHYYCKKLPLQIIKKNKDKYAALETIYINGRKNISRSRKGWWGGVVGGDKHKHMLN